MLKDLIMAIGEAVDIEPTIEQLPRQPGDVKRTYADVKKAGELLGYSPSISIKEGLQRFGNWVKTYYANRPVEV